MREGYFLFGRRPGNGVYSPLALAAVSREGAVNAPGVSTIAQAVGVIYAQMSLRAIDLLGGPFEARRLIRECLVRELAKERQPE